MVVIGLNGSKVTAYKLPLTVVQRYARIFFLRLLCLIIQLTTSG